MNRHIGRQVKALRDLHAGWLPSPVPSVRSGARGIIRDVAAPGGFLTSPKYVVEFLNGVVLECTTRDVRLSWLAGGERDFAARQAVVGGVRLGGLILAALALIPLIPYFLFDGGSLTELAAALPEAILYHLLDLVVFLGLPITLLLIAGVLLWNRVKRN